MSRPFSLAFVRQNHFGVLAAVHLPLEASEVPEDVMAALGPTERAAALELGGFRRADFVGGRLAFQEALRASQRPPQVLRVGPRGEPVVEASLSVSISHKRPYAVALVSDSSHGTIGVDLEGGDGRERLSIAPRVLRPEELERMHALEEAQRWPFVQRHFAVKEAVYKAIHPHLNRFVGFHEAAVALRDDGQPHVTLELQPGEPTLQLEVHCEGLGASLLAFARATRASQP